MSLKEKLKPIAQNTIPKTKPRSWKKELEVKKVARPEGRAGDETENQSQQAKENENQSQETGNESDLQQDGTEAPARKRTAAEKKLAALAKVEKSVKSVVNVSARLADRLTEEDRAKAKQTIVEAMSANGCRFNTETKLWEEFPDHRIRLAAATLQLAYDEGTPIQRQIVLTGKFDTDEAILDRLAASPEASAALAALEKAGFVVNRPQAGPILDAEIVPSEG
jgi:hypothetical protein